MGILWEPESQPISEIRLDRTTVNKLLRHYYSDRGWKIIEDDDSCLLAVITTPTLF